MTHEDDRLWGRRFTFQNQRLLYWPLLMSNDFDLMKSFFDYYWNQLPIRTAITKAWFGQAGAYYRENIEPTGGERDCGRTSKPLNKANNIHDRFALAYGLSGDYDNCTTIPNQALLTG
jgi:hypothetical protein